MACQLKEKKKPKHARTRTHTHALTQNKTKKKQYLSTVYLIYNKHKLNYFTMLPFLIQKMPILGVYIYFFFQWFTVDLFLNILVLLHATVSCI